MRHLCGLVVAAAVGSAAVAADGKFALTGDNTEVKFTGTKPGGKHDGGFKTLTGTVTTSGTDFSAAKIDVVIDTESLHSDDPKLTGHLKSPDFFDVKTNPSARFASTKVEKADGVYRVTGDLTLNGKTKTIVFPAAMGLEDGAFKLAAEFPIKRLDFGLGAKFPAEKISDDVTIKVQVTAKP